MNRRNLLRLSLTSAISPALCGGLVSAQDGGDLPATIEAQATKIAKLQATNEALRERLETPTPTEPAQPNVDEQGRARLEDPLVLADGLSLLHYWFAPPAAGTESLLVLGELLNSTGVELDAPPLGLALYDEGGNVLGSMYALPITHVIPPDRPMPFVGDFYDPPFTVSEIASSDIGICVPWGTTDEITQYGFGFSDLVAEDIREIERSLSHFELSGVVRNNSSIPADNVRVQVAIYDTEGKLVGVEESYPGIPSIPAGKTARFTVDAYSGGSSRGRPLQYVDSLDFTYELWIARDSQVWLVGC